MDTKKKRRVVITGLGTVNPTGNTVAESWANIKADRCAVGPITAFDTADFKVKLAAEVKDFDPAARIDKREARKMARFTQFAVAAADEAVRDSGLALEEIDHTRFGVILSSGIGGLPTIEEEHTRGQQRGFEKVSPYFVPMSIGNMAAGHPKSVLPGSRRHQAVYIHGNHRRRVWQRLPYQRQRKHPVQENRLT